MRIGIDISQIVYEGTGVGTYVRRLVEALVDSDTVNEYVLFGASLRRKDVFISFYRSLQCDKSNIRLSIWSIPPTVLDILWNVLHIIPITWFVGQVDVFWSSDWTQPPLGNAIGVTTIHDLSVLRYPKSFNKKILTVQKRRLARAKKECSVFLCDSEATKKDVVDLLHIDVGKAHVVYPGFTAV
jgi:hypothetical protein